MLLVWLLALAGYAAAALTDGPCLAALIRPTLTSAGYAVIPVDDPNNNNGDFLTILSLPTELECRVCTTPIESR